MSQTVEGLLTFISESPSPFHAVANMRAELEQAGYRVLSESDAWECAPGGKYLVTRNDSSLIAFRTGSDPAESGIRMVGAHTDSPCLKIKPRPEIRKEGYLQLGVEVYGGALLNPWFDRDLGIAGRVYGRAADGGLIGTLFDSGHAVATIPSLAIHLDRDANKQRSVNPQRHLPAVVMLDEDGQDFHALLLDWMAAGGNQPLEAVLDYELCLYDTQPASLTGWNREFVSAARLDNLLSCYVGMRALLDQDSDLPCLLVCNDHEEVGSQSAVGAQGPFLHSVLQRLCGGGEAFTRAMTRSVLVSADNAHAVHPNYADRHDANHRPRINGGPVIKVNAGQRYASNSETNALFRRLCQQADVPVQDFVMRSDLRCGSTIGPITASEIGVRTVDVGAPQLSMHSAREMCGRDDVEYLYRALRAFYRAEA